MKYKLKSKQDKKEEFYKHALKRKSSVFSSN